MGAEPAAGCSHRAGLPGGRLSGTWGCALSPPALPRCRVFTVGLGLPLTPPPCPAVPCTTSCWSPACVPSLQLVSDTRRMSDLQWFREAYGAVTQTVRVVASEQSRQQRGWAFTPGEPSRPWPGALLGPPSGLLEVWLGPLRSEGGLTASLLLIEVQRGGRKGQEAA